MIVSETEPVVIDDPKNPGKRAIMYEQTMDDGKTVTVIVPEDVVWANVPEPN